MQYSDELTQDELKTVLITPGHHTYTSIDVGRMARDLNALFKIANTINSIRDPERLQTQLLELIFEVVPAATGAILLMSHADEEPRAAHTHERHPGGAPLKIRKTAHPSRVVERASVFTQSSSDLAAAENIMCVPLIGVQNTIGVIYLASTGLKARFAEDHVQFLNSAAGIAAVTLENVLSFDALKQENRRLREVLEPSDTIIGESKSMRRLGAFIDKVAKGDSTVLIRGESGTGKELVARAIHAGSARSEKPFVAINCAAIPETLLESELFGNEKGAFTGAVFKKASWRPPKTAPSSWTKSANWRRCCKPSCCAFCSRENSIASEALALSSFGLAYWPPPTRTWSRPSRRPSSGKISFTASMWCQPPCRRCASIAKTSLCSPFTSPPSMPSNRSGLSKVSLLKRAPF